MKVKFKHSYSKLIQSEKSGDQIKIGPKKKIAFVCSGGATKAGAFHLGVALALQEQGFRFYGGTVPPNQKARPPSPMEISMYVGSSAGAIISSYLAAGYSLDNIFNSFLDYKPPAGDITIDPKDEFPKILPRLTYPKMFKIRSKFTLEQLSQLGQLRKALMRLMFQGDWESLVQLKWLKLTGLFSTHGIEQYMREEVLSSNQFQDYLADLFIVATQLNHSRKVVFGKYQYQPPPHDLSCQYNNDVSISEACAASTSLPVIFSPYGIKNSDGQLIYYIDGEIRDTLSTHVAVDGGADLVIASYTHQPYHVFKESESLTGFGLSAIIIQSIYLLVEQKINNHIYSKALHHDTILAVSQYCETQGVSVEHKTKICELLENQLHYKMDVETIYIHPSAHDRQIFFGDHFSLSSKKMSEIVKSGFRAAIEVLKKYDFSDRTQNHAIGSV